MVAPLLGILGAQQAPAAALNADVYTVPGSRRAVISTLVVANTSASDTAFRVHARKAGAAAGVGNALCYEVDLPANSTTALTLGIALAATDVLTVRSTDGGVTFTAFGEETDVPAA